MPAEGREQVTRIRISRVNGQPEELEGLDGRRQPSMGGTSRVSREAQARICEGLRVQFPGPTRQPHPFRHPSFYFKGRSGSSAGLPSHSGRSSDGGAGSSPSTRRAGALGEATQADLCGSISLGPIVAVLDLLTIGPGHRETGDGDCLAPPRV